MIFAKRCIWLIRDYINFNDQAISKQKRKQIIKDENIREKLFYAD